MNDSFLDWKETKNIKPIAIDIKSKLLLDIINIENSWTGRIDINIANAFIQESAQLLINSLLLFEKGYFDCAYYSLRQSLELSTTMIYLSDIPEDEREIQTEAWKSTSDFPMQGQMLKYLKENGYLFSDMKEKMTSYFDKLLNFNKMINKFVHKQGFKFFYVSRNHSASQSNVDFFSKNYIAHLKECIGYIAVMRLAIDAFPVLLLDEEMYHRSFEPMTGSYSLDFVEEYIGNEVLEKYKTTEVFLGLYNAIIQNTKRSNCSTNIIKFQYIDTLKLDIIKSEEHLLSPMDNIVVQLVDNCPKIKKIYCYDGLLTYTTDRTSNRKIFDYNSSIFHDFKNNIKQYNMPYDNVFVSIIQHKEEDYFIEHNEIILKSKLIELSNKIKNNPNNQVE